MWHTSTRLLSFLLGNLLYLLKNILIKKCLTAHAFFFSGVRRRFRKAGPFDRPSLYALNANAGTLDRQYDTKGRSLAKNAVDFDPPAVALNDAVGKREP